MGRAGEAEPARALPVLARAQQNHGGSGAGICSFAAECPAWGRGASRYSPLPISGHLWLLLGPPGLLPLPPSSRAAGAPSPCADTTSCVNEGMSVAAASQALKGGWVPLWLPAGDPPSVPDGLRG